jgi:hypothetical protein
MRKKDKRADRIETLISTYFAMMLTHHPRAATPPTDKSHPEGIYIGSKTMEGRIASGGRNKWEYWQIVTLSPNRTVLKWDLHENDRIFIRVLRIF